MSGRLPILLFLLGSLATPLPASGIGTSADTTVAGRTYALLSATDLMAQLREARKPIHLREKAVTGPLYAPSPRRLLMGGSSKTCCFSTKSTSTK